MSGGSQTYNMVTVLNGGSSSYVLSDLKKFTKYEFFLVPFYKSVEGPPSNSKIAQTLEDGKSKKNYYKKRKKTLLFYFVTYLKIYNQL